MINQTRRTFCKVDDNSESFFCFPVITREQGQVKPELWALFTGQYVTIEGTQWTRLE